MVSFALRGLPLYAGIRHDIIIARHQLRSELVILIHRQIMLYLTVVHPSIALRVIALLKSTILYDQIVLQAKLRILLVKSGC